MPPIIPPMRCDASSSARRWASLTAATMRSCSISTSSGDTTSGSMRRLRISLTPFMTTVTMPPPAVASTVASLSCFCRFSCICCACCIIF